MSKKGRVAVIGSGHAALGACMVLTRYPDLQIDVIDIGLTAPYPNQAETPIPNGKTCQGSYFPYGLNDLRSPVSLDSQRICSSHAYGGFSNVYSGAVLAPRDEDLVSWPKDSIPLPQDYRFVLSHIGVISANDCLESWSPVIPPIANHVKGSRAERQSESILGFSRIAARLDDGKVQAAPYNTSFAFDVFRERQQVNYKGSTYVHSLVKTPNGVQVWAISEGSLSCHGEYDAVFLAAGCINTTGIAHRSCRPNLEAHYEIQNTGGFVQGFVGKGPEYSSELELRRRNNLPELFLEIRNPDFSGHWSHTQISAVNRYVLETVAQRLPSMMIKKFSHVAEKFHFAITNVHSVLNAPSTMVCSPIGSSKNSIMRHQIRIQEPTPTREVKWRQSVRTAIKDNAKHLNMRHIPGSERLGNILRGNQLGGWHLGGTLPMSENDVAANPTCTPQGELRGLSCVFVVDSAAFPSIPGTTVALLSMAHAAKVARQWVEAHVI